MLPLKKWNLLNDDPDVSLISVLLKNRNLSSQHLEKFKLSDRLYDPYLLKDMEIAVKRILRAIERKESIIIFGDYDVDGIVSTVLMINFFEKIGLSVEYIIPDRQTDGYGLRSQNMREIKRKKIDLLITVDNGISSHEAVEIANRANIDVIITDHHVSEESIPPALAVINPNRNDCTYPFKGLCGAGIAYKLIHALSEQLFVEQEFKNFMLSQLDLVALATIADVSPIRDENYALLKFGLKALTKTSRPGLVELKRISGLLGKEITPTAVGFYLGPRLNAAGRMEKASIAVELLLNKSKERAAEIAKKLNVLNNHRQNLQDKFINQALDYIHNSDIKDHHVYIVDNEEWEIGLIGIISGKLKDKYTRPVIAFTRDGDGNYVGSARSLSNFHITKALSRFRDLYINYGGHQKAAGLTIPAHNFNLFKTQFAEYINTNLSLTDLIPELVIDSAVAIDQLNESTVLTIQEIGPFGEENPEPILLIKNVKIRDIFLLSQGKHLKIIVQKGNRLLECMWWGRGDLKDILSFNMNLDLVFKPSINLWSGVGKLQLIIEDAKISNG